MRSLTPHSIEARRTGAAVHQILVPSVARIFSHISNIRKASGNSNQHNRAIKDLAYSVRLLREQVKRVTVNDRYDLRKTTLTDALNATANEFVELRPLELRITFDGVELIEDEPLPTRKMFFDVIVEAISNSVQHGRATLVKVGIESELFLIKIKIEDDGNGLPRKINRNKPFGIFYLAKRLRREMSGHINFLPVKPHGTLVVLEMPIRPVRSSNGNN
jgi:signal transduction histidine kinase